MRKVTLAPAVKRMINWPQTGVPQPVEAIQPPHRKGLWHLTPPPRVPMFPGEMKHSKNSNRTGIITIKRGMTSLFDEWGQFTPVTILQVVECQVIATRYEPKCGTYMTQLGCVNQLPRRVSRARLGHFRRFAIHPKKKIHEFKTSADAVIPSGAFPYPRHNHIRPTLLARPTAKPKRIVSYYRLGKGFQGVMKRHGFKGLNASHGVSLAHRSAGSTGQRQLPGKVFKGKKMAGRMGGKTRTVKNLRVMKIDGKLDLIYVKGCVPGPEHMYVKVKDSIMKKWYGKCFPAGMEVPFPTWMKGKVGFEKEFVAGADESKSDPLLRQKREVPR